MLDVSIGPAPRPRAPGVGAAGAHRLRRPSVSWRPAPARSGRPRGPCQAPTSRTAGGGHGPDMPEAGGQGGASAGDGIGGGSAVDGVGGGAM